MASTRDADGNQICFFLIRQHMSPVYLEQWIVDYIVVDSAGGPIRLLMQKSCLRNHCIVSVLFAYDG